MSYINSHQPQIFGAIHWKNLNYLEPNGSYHNYNFSISPTVIYITYGSAFVFLFPIHRLTGLIQTVSTTTYCDILSSIHNIDYDTLTIDYSILSHTCYIAYTLFFISMDFARFISSFIFVKRLSLPFTPVIHRTLTSVQIVVFYSRYIGPSIKLFF